MAALVHRVFDGLEALVSRHGTRRAFSTFLLVMFATLLLGVELHPGGWLGGLLPEAWVSRLPHTHMHVIEVVFNVLLAFEVLEMVLGLGQSLSGATGRHFVLFALILLRRSFEALADLPEPTLFEDELTAPVVHLIADAFGGLVVFGLLGLYYRQLRRRPITSDKGLEGRFIAFKKAIALILLLVLVALAAHSLWVYLVEHEPGRLFEKFFTAFIFADVALLLVTLRYTGSYHVLFRNTGFAVCGVLLRIALSAPSPWDAGIGVVAMLFGLGLVAVYARVAPEMKKAAESEEDSQELGEPDDDASRSGERARASGA